MPRHRKPTPSYLLHKNSGRARAVWTDAFGSRQFRLLPGAYASAESRTAFARLQLELESTPHHQITSSSSVSVSEVLLAFLRHAEQHYRGSNGKTTNEYEEYKVVARYVRELYGELPALNFGPLALKAIRQKFIEARWSRGFINQRVGRIRRIFKWATSEELVPATVFQSLATVTGLQRGRTKAKETEPVLSVADPTVNATLPFLNRHVRGLVEFQRLTGCRPGEACDIRWCDIDRSGVVWIYKPPHHKTAWRGKTRTIAIGPLAQELLKQFVTTNADDYLFSPKQAVEEIHAARSAQRQTPRYPSHMARNATKRKQHPKRKADVKYNRGSYGVAIDRACDKAFPLPPELAQRNFESVKTWWARLNEKERNEVKAWQRSHRWHPHQLRHAYATKVRKEFDLEAAQVMLGHSRADVTQIYAEKNEALAVTIAAKIG